jgi:transposase
MTRWRCRNDRCERRIFAERLPELTTPFARRTARLAGIVRLFGHGAGGRPSERLMTRLGMPVSDTTILRDLKRSARSHAYPVHVRVARIDDWAWRKGMTYGTVIVDLERRRVVDLLPDRSAASTATWLKAHPEVEIVSRDRAGLYAEGAREGSPQALQVADRFHCCRISGKKRSSGSSAYSARRSGKRPLRKRFRKTPPLLQRMNTRHYNPLPKAWRGVARARML